MLKINSTASSTITNITTVMAHETGQHHLMVAIRKFVNEFPGGYELTRDQPFEEAVEKVEQMADDLAQ